MCPLLACALALQFTAGQLRAGGAEGKACRIAGFLGSKPHSRERGGKEEWGQLAASAADVYNVY